MKTIQPILAEKASSRRCAELAGRLQVGLQVRPKALGSVDSLGLRSFKGSILNIVDVDYYPFQTLFIVDPSAAPALRPPLIANGPAIAREIPPLPFQLPQSSRTPRL